MVGVIMKVKEGQAYGGRGGINNGRTPTEDGIQRKYKGNTKKKQGVLENKGLGQMKNCRESWKK